MTLKISPGHDKIVVEDIFLSKNAIVLLTWQRLGSLKHTLQSLATQTSQDFDLYISNGNIPNLKKVEADAKYFDGLLDIWVRHDGNEKYAFRRLLVGKDLAEQGYQKILFIDDDIRFTDNYVKNVLSQWEPKTYKSGYAWTLNGSDYYRNRKRVYSNKESIKYCGTGISMVDAKLFLEKDLIDNCPPGALKIEDLWMSYYVDHVLKRKKWKLKYMKTPDVIIGGVDKVALHQQIKKAEYNKADFLNDLVDMGWKL